MSVVDLEMARLNQQESNQLSRGQSRVYPESQNNVQVDADQEEFDNMFLTKVQEDKKSPLDFLLHNLKNDFQSEAKSAITDSLENFQKVMNLIDMLTCCCFSKASFQVSGFVKSTGINSQSKFIKRFYGNIQFNDEASNFILFQILKSTNNNDPQSKTNQIIRNYYGDQFINYMCCDDNYEDLNSDYFCGKRCEYGCEVTYNYQIKAVELYIGYFFNNKYHGEGKLLNFPVNNQTEKEQFFAGEKEKELFYFLQENYEVKYCKPKVIKQVQDLGMKNGKGTYHGEVNEKDEKNGWGEFEFQNKNKYKGQWKDDKMHGTGHYTWANGEEYLGEYYNGRKHGFGRYKYQNNKEYLGQFYEGRQHGLALMKNSHSLNLQTKWYHGQYLI